MKTYLYILSLSGCRQPKNSHAFPITVPEHLRASLSKVKIYLHGNHFKIPDG